MMFGQKREMGISEDCGFSPVSQQLGLSCFFFFTLLSELDHRLNDQSLDKAGREYGFIDQFIYPEDFLNAINIAGIVLND
ncbi:hypothetical protein [Alteromonas facilis]|uniref:hypothetical protein n=1 Tax=Alteromonas facilis TaxID=2048004 RepID=UPI000C2830A3|nr:hypothetical protein [Alteromonas facilis]